MTFLTDLWVTSWREAMPDIDFDVRRSWLGTVLANPANATRVIAGPDGPLGFATREGDYLHQLVVASAAKGCGAASRLLDDAKAASPAGLVLDVNQANHRAIRFYEREGFTIESAGANPGSRRATWRMRWTTPHPRHP